MKTTLVALCYFLTASAAHADLFRCPNGSIVSTGDSLGVVATKCDPPTFVSRRDEPVSRGHRTAYIEVQEWTYNEGPDRLLHTLVFRNGILHAVQINGYGR